jgi:hypothetical protein
MIDGDEVVCRPGAEIILKTRARKSMASRRPKKDPSKRSQLPKRLFKRGRGPAIPHGNRVVYEPAGVEKMSAVLEDFVEPYRALADTEDGFRNLLNLGMLAWNAALLPEDQRRAMIDEMLAAGLSRAPGEVRARARELVEALVRRKEEHFAANRRMIVSFTLTDRGDDYHLSVASTL